MIFKSVKDVSLLYLKPQSTILDDCETKFSFTCNFNPKLK